MSVQTCVYIQHICMGLRKVHSTAYQQKRQWNPGIYKCLYMYMYKYNSSTKICMYLI